MKGLGLVGRVDSAPCGLVRGYLEVALRQVDTFTLTFKNRRVLAPLYSVRVPWSPHLFFPSFEYTEPQLTQWVMMGPEDRSAKSPAAVSDLAPSLFTL